MPKFLARSVSREKGKESEGNQSYPRSNRLKCGCTKDLHCHILFLVVVDVIALASYGVVRRCMLTTCLHR